MTSSERSTFPPAVFEPGDATPAAPIFRAVDQHSGAVAERPPSAFWAVVLAEADKRAGGHKLAAVGYYSCPCGSAFEFATDSTLEDYAALNRWLGRHDGGRCQAEEQRDELRVRVQELEAEVDYLAGELAISQRAFLAAVQR